MVKYSSLEKVPDYIMRNLGKYFTNVGGDTFVIRNLPPELAGGALARYSRAHTGIQLTLVNEFLDDNGKPNQEKGSALMDRVLNAFGDESVGELEGAHMGIEDISQLLTKEIEDRRIGGSPIEQSTRYVRYDQKNSEGEWRYLRPKEIRESGLLGRFEETNDRAFEVYSKGVVGLTDYFKIQVPEEEFEIEVDRDGEKVKVKKSDLENDAEFWAHRIAYNFTVRCAALDVGRCVLPSSALTHVGLFGNGRFYTTLITHLGSSELYEARERSGKIREELDKHIPTFVKRSRVDAKREEINRRMNDVSSELFSGMIPKTDFVTLVPYASQHASFMDEVVSAALFPYTNISLGQILDVVSGMPEERKMEVIKTYRGKRESRRDRTGRGLEAGYPIKFDLVGGFAEYRDLERHRMLTQQRQILTTDLGFILPSEMVEVGLENEVLEVVGMMEDLNGELRKEGLTYASQYATLFNNRIRFMMGMNLREFQHLSELRTTPTGHFSYRSMVMKMASQLSSRDPWSKEFYEFVDYSDPGSKISRANEQSRIAGKNLAKGIKGDDDF